MSALPLMGLAISSSLSVRYLRVLSMPRLMEMGFAPAVTDWSPRRIISLASTDGVGELDGARDGDAVVDDLGHADLLGEHDVTASGAEGDANRVGDDVDALLDLNPGLHVEGELLGVRADLEGRAADADRAGGAGGGRLARESRAGGEGRGLHDAVHLATTGCEAAGERVTC